MEEKSPVAILSRLTLDAPLFINLILAQGHIWGPS